MNHGFLDSNMWLFGLLFWLGHKRDLITEYPVLYNSEYSGTHRCFILQVLFSFDKRRDFLSIEVLDTFYNIKHNRKSWFFFFYWWGCFFISPGWESTSSVPLPSILLSHRWLLTSHHSSGKCAHIPLLSSLTKR